MVLLERRTFVIKLSLVRRMLYILSVIFVHISAVSGTFGTYYYDVLPLEKCPTGSLAKSRCGGDVGDCMPGYNCLPPTSIHIYPGVLPGICCPQIQTCPMGTEPGPLCSSKIAGLCPSGFDCFKGVCCKSHVMMCPINSKPGGGLCNDAVPCKPGYFCYKGTCCSIPKFKSLCSPTYFRLEGLTCKHHIHCPGKAICSSYQCCIRKKPLKKIKFPKKYPPKKKRPLKEPRPQVGKGPSTKPRLPPDKRPKPILQDFQPPKKVPKPIQKPKPRLPPSKPRLPPPSEPNVRMLFPPTVEPTTPRSSLFIKPTVKPTLPPTCPLGYRHQHGLKCDHILSCPGSGRCISGVCCTKTATGVCPSMFKPVPGINCNLRQRCPTNTYCISGVCCQAPTCPPSYIHLQHLSCDIGTCAGNGECISGLCCTPEGIPVTGLPTDAPFIIPTTVPTLSRFDAIPDPVPVQPSPLPSYPLPSATPTTWSQPSALPPLFLKSPTTAAPPIIIPVINITDPSPPLSPVYIPWDPLPTTPASPVVTPSQFTYVPTTGSPLIPTFNPSSFNSPTSPSTIKQTLPPISVPSVTNRVLAEVRQNITLPPFVPTFNPRSFNFPTSIATTKQTNPPVTVPSFADPFIPNIQLNTTLPSFIPTFNPDAFIRPSFPTTSNTPFVSGPMPSTQLPIKEIFQPTTPAPTFIPEIFKMPSSPSTKTVPSVTSPVISTQIPMNKMNKIFQPSTPVPIFPVKDPLPFIEPILRPDFSNTVSHNFKTSTIIPPTTSQTKRSTHHSKTPLIPMNPVTLPYTPFIPTTFPSIKPTEPSATFPPFPTFPSYIVKSATKVPTLPYTFLPNIPPSIFPTFPPIKISSKQPSFTKSTTATSLPPLTNKTLPPSMPTIFPPTNIPPLLKKMHPFSPTSQNHIHNLTYPPVSTSLPFDNFMNTTTFQLVDGFSKKTSTAIVPPKTFLSTSTAIPFIRTNWNPSTPTYTLPTPKPPLTFPQQSRPTLPPIAMTFPPDPPTVTSIRVITTTMRTRFIGSTTQRPRNLTSLMTSPKSPNTTPKVITKVPKIRQIALTCPPGNISIPGLTCDGVYKCPAGSNCYNSICCLSVERIQVPACPIGFLSLDPCPKPPQADLCAVDQDCGPFMVCCLTSCDQRVCRPMVAPQQIIPR